MDSAGEFDRLDEACDLFAAGRANAARGIWNGLSEDFRVRVMKFVLFVFQHRHYLDDLPDADFETRFGKWRGSRQRVEAMLAAVPKLSQT